MADDASGPGDDRRADRAATEADDRRSAGDGGTNASDREPPGRDETRARDERFGSVARDDREEEYRVPLDLSGEDDADDADEPDDEYAPEPSSTPIEPGDPKLENVVFVFLGAVAMALVLFRLVSLPL